VHKFCNYLYLTCFVTDENETVRCADIKCPKLNPSHCVGVTPPGACCKVCGEWKTLLALLDCQT
jgi:hypothetical protein